MKIPHRSWLVCLGGALALFTSMGLGINVFSAYQPSIISLNGFSNAQGSLITTVRSLFAILAMFSAGKVVERIGLRATMGVGMGCSVLAYVVFGLATTFPAYCLGGALAGLSYALAGMIPLAIVVSRWFAVGRGFALGLSAAATGIATIVMPPLIALSLERQGLSTTFFYEAGLMAVLGLLVVLLVRNSPQELGLTPFGSDQTPETSVRPEKTTSIPPALWRVVLVAAFLVGAPAGTGFSHLTVLFSTEGFASEEVTLLLSYLGLMIMIFKVVYGRLSDRLGGFYSNFFAFGFTALGALFCCMAPMGSMVLALLAMTCVAMGLPISSVTLSVWAFNLSSYQQYERRVRLLTASYMLGNLSFGWLPGFVADRLGSYVPAYAIFGIITLVSMAMIQTVYLRYAKN